MTACLNAKHTLRGQTGLTVAALRLVTVPPPHKELDFSEALLLRLFQGSESVLGSV